VSYIGKLEIRKDFILKFDNQRDEIIVGLRIIQNLVFQSWVFRNGLH